MPTTDVQIRLFADSRALAKCRGCDAPIEFYETLSGRMMPMNAGAAPRTSETDASGRVIGHYAAEDTHWATCPERARFSRKAARV
jgi:hypothetical protein